MGNLMQLIKKSQKKNIRLFYQISSICDLAKPRWFKKCERKRMLRSFERLAENVRLQAQRRIEHYNKLSPNTSFSLESSEQQIYSLANLKMHATINGRRSGSNYCYDTLRYTRCYDQNLKACFVFGDVFWVPEQPSLVKSRPINGDNRNSVLMPLNRIRHFNFISDSSSFESKHDMLIGVSYAQQQHRQDFLKMYFGHPMCRVGSAEKFTDERRVWNVEHISIVEQLEYKFILCLEGYDVATNLKWVMSSNSIAVMPKPKYETWFMESQLIGGVHYIEIAEDYSDVEERLQYYIDHPDEAQGIIEAAHRFVDQFRNKKLERIIATKVTDRYFERTNQDLC